tara:strand:- start:667 stop:888 length:222 start_codon:yes stop_codon:yes gene_type:complete
MKISINRNDGTTVSWESESEDLDMVEVTEVFKGLLVAYGYHPKSVDEHIHNDDAFDWGLFQDEEKIKICSDDI